METGELFCENIFRNTIVIQRAIHVALANVLCTTKYITPS